MGLKGFFEAQKTIRSLRAEVTSLERQKTQAERDLQSSSEQICHVKKEAERQEQCQCDAVETGRLVVEKKLFEVLQPLLLNMPSARAAIAANPALLARDMIGMFAPLDDFIKELGLEMIGAVGAEVPFDSTRHDCANEIAPGTLVRVVTVGYCRGEEIWIKARVKEQ